MLTIKTIRDLSNFTFVIPSYQRGYRWEDTQVIELLRDLREFINENSEDKEVQEYILQPIVVQAVENKNNEFVLIDGQQRLTTLYLILNYLNHKEEDGKIPSFKMKFDQRKEQENFINNKTFADENDQIYLKNIDNFYIKKAYDCIKDWFRQLKEDDEDTDTNLDAYETMSKFRTALSTLKKKISDYRPAVSVIWYELNFDAIEAFDRLNYRRINLTGTELVKAFLLAARDGDEKSAINRAHAWDRMEKSLQDPYFWSMLGTENPELGHIDLILDIVADQIKENLINNKDFKDKISRERDPLKFNYYVINQFYRENRGKKWEEISKEIWNLIETQFNQIRNWYDNPEWYNLIGLWSRIADRNKKSIIKEIVKIEKDYKEKGKEIFKQQLQKKVGQIIKKKVTKYLEENEKGFIHPIEAKNFSYNNSNAHNDIRAFLLAFNVYTLKNETAEKFPFYLYDLYQETSLEHIHPQNITFEMTRKDIKQWVTNRITDLKELGIEDNSDIEKHIKNLDIELDTNKSFWDKDVPLKEESEEWNKIKDDVAAIDRSFGDLANITEDELHKISNLALVNQPANSALSNYYLTKKREILNERDKKRVTFERQTHSNCKEKCDDGMYLMPATKKVFNKYYSSANPGDMRFWRKEDREAYLKALKGMYNMITNE